MEKRKIELDIMMPAKHCEIFDSHAHYDDECFNEIRDVLLARQNELGVGGIINCAVDLFDSAKKCLEMSNNYKFCHTAIGVHPLDMDHYPFDEQRFRSLLAEPGVIAVGEIGLDYHYTPNTRQQQLSLARRQIEIANELSLPVVFHDRDAHEDTLNLLRDLRPTGVLHCFSGSPAMAQQVIDLGLYIGIGGVVTFLGAKKPQEVARFIPLDRLLLETDAPYLAPVPYRGTICHSAQIVRVAEKIAELRGCGREEVLAISQANAHKLFHI